MHTPDQTPGEYEYRPNTSFFATALTILSYATVILPLLALGVRALNRWDGGGPFYIFNEQEMATRSASCVLAKQLESWHKVKGVTSTSPIQVDMTKCPFKDNKIVKEVRFEEPSLLTYEKYLKTLVTYMNANMDTHRCVSLKGTEVMTGFRSENIRKALDFLKEQGLVYDYTNNYSGVVVQL